MSAFAIRTKPHSAADHSKIRRTTVACSGLTWPKDVLPPALPVSARGRAEHLDVVVPEDAAAGDVARPRLPDHRVIGPLAGLLALHLGSEGRQREEDLVHGVVEGPLAVLEVEEDADAGVHDVLERPARLDRLAAEARLLRHDENLEGRPRLERIHQAEEARALQKLGAGDPVGGVDLGLGDGPALAHGIAARVRDLAGDRFLLVGEVLLGALAGVDRGNHHGGTPLWSGVCRSVADTRSPHFRTCSSSKLFAKALALCEKKRDYG